MAKDPIVSIGQSELESARFMPITVRCVNANIGELIKKQELVAQPEDFGLK